MNKKTPLWLFILVLICLGFSAILGFVQTHGSNTRRKARKSPEMAAELFNYDKVIMDKIEECSISRAASKHAGYLAALIAEHAIQTSTETEEKNRISANKVDKFANNTQINKQLNKNL